MIGTAVLAVVATVMIVALFIDWWLRNRPGGH